MDPTFFASAAALRTWLEAHHTTAAELVVGFYKKASGRGGITYPEAVDEALCFGWIDGIRRRVDGVSYSVRFTPRRKDSMWSQVNIDRVGELKAEGRMRPAGLAAFGTLREGDGRRYSYEQLRADLDPAYEAEFRAHGGPWSYFVAQAPSYRRAAIYWVMEAKKEETRRRRLAALIDDSARSRRLRQFARPEG